MASGFLQNSTIWRRCLKQLPEEVEILHRIWEQQYVEIEGGVRVLDLKEMPEAARRVESPYETEARYSTKGAMSWVGYKVHLTESCDDEDLPNLITSVRTTVTTATDVKQLCAIQEGLSRSGLLPAEQLADAAYDVCGSNLVSSHARQIATSSVHPTETNLATKCATHSGTHAVGQTEDHGAATGIPYVEPGPRDGRPPRCNLLRVELSARTIVARVSCGRVRFSLVSGGV